MSQSTDFFTCASDKIRVYCISPSFLHGELINNDDSDDGMLDDRDEDPDYQPYEKNARIRCEILFAESENVEDSVRHSSKAQKKNNFNWHNIDDHLEWTPNTTAQMYSSLVKSVCGTEKPNKPLKTNEHELEQFIGTCMYMSVYRLPRTRMYWAANTRVEKVADVSLDSNSSSKTKIN
ncbi:hypothetical protein ILUMI_12907 [Ignelater luminosus]|uniref:PiggyBac transposable element-derived protein domain-containing protein n=1 Tax=Ignelater luminosus TaxID=2038154 RepID=A0A8K0CYQ9_IGNLU|nr:hypothetical protein ILUMI_12907 [Ignelater luminosus]